MTRDNRSTVSDAWRRDHPWSSVYVFGMSHPALSNGVGRIAFGTGFAGLRRAISRIGDVPQGGTVLDVPCGSGIALSGLAKRTTPIRYIAADIAPTMLKRTAAEASRRRVTVETIEADVAHLPLDDHSVDLVLSLTGLHCFPDPHAAVAELARVCGHRMELTWFRSDVGIRYRPVLAIARGLGVVGPSASAAEVEGWLTDAGFDVETTVEGSFVYLSALRAE